MATVFDRVRTLRWLRVALAIMAIGILTAVLAVVILFLTTSGSKLNISAATVSVVASCVTISAAVFAAWRGSRHWLSGNSLSLTAVELLKQRVRDREEAVLATMLNGLTPANLGYADTSRGSLPAPESTVRKAAQNTAEQVWNTLLRFRKDGTRVSVDGTLTGIGAYYRELSARGDKRLLILGKPGSGKTVLAIELILQFLQEDSSRQDLADNLGAKIPVRFNVADWTMGTDVRRWLTQKLIADYLIPEVTAMELVSQRKILPVLDGLDEMDSSPGSEISSRAPVAPRAAAFLKALNTYADLNQPAAVVLTCREDTYALLRSSGAMTGNYREITIRDLDAARISSYLQARYPDPFHPQRRGWEQVLAWLEQPTGAAALRVLSTPWRLLLAVIAAEGGEQPAKMLATAPSETLNSATERIDRQLLAAYVPAATRVAVRRWAYGMSTSQYDPAQATRWMHSLARHMEWQAQRVTEAGKVPIGMSGVDLFPHLLWPIGGPRLVRAVHAASAFLIMSIAIFAALHLERDRLIGIETPLFSLSKSSPAWSFLLAILVSAYSAKYWHTANYLEGSRQSLAQRSTVPRDGLRRERRYAITGGLVGGLATWCIVDSARAPLGGSRTALSYGLVVGTATLLIIGSLWIRCMIGVSCAQARGRLPLSFKKFMKWACDSGLLRIAGPAYEFRHRQLQGWLIRSSSDPR